MALPGPMSDGRRAELAEGALRHVLDHGLAGLALRPLAAELGTSDRMLIYYFGTRDALVAAVLERAATRLRDLFAAAMPDERSAPSELLAHALGAAGDDEARRLLRLWLEVVALAGRGDEACRTTARTVLAEWLTWVEDRLDVPPEQRRTAAAGLLATVDGLMVLDAIDADVAVDAAQWLLTPPAS